MNYASYGMIEAMLEPFMRSSLGTNQRDVSYAFLISGLVYLPSAPIAGFVRCEIQVKIETETVLCLLSRLVIR